MNIEVHQKPTSRMVEIFIWQERGSMDIFYTTDGGFLVAQEVERSNLLQPEAVKPFLELPAVLFHALLEAMAAEAKKQGISTAEENQLKGKLDAVQGHLADMQQMSKTMLEFITRTTNQLTTP